MIFQFKKPNAKYGCFLMPRVPRRHPLLMHQQFQKIPMLHIMGTSINDVRRFWPIFDLPTYLSPIWSDFAWPTYLMTSDFGKPTLPPIFFYWWPALIYTSYFSYVYVDSVFNIQFYIMSIRTIFQKDSSNLFQHRFAIIDR